MEISRDRWYAFCDRHRGVVDGQDGVIQAHKDGERCDFRRCKQVGTWEWFGGRELLD